MNLAMLKLQNMCPSYGMPVSEVSNLGVPKIIIDDAVSFLKTAISILVMSNHNSFRVLLDKVASVYFFIWKKCIYILALENCYGLTLPKC